MRHNLLYLRKKAKKIKFYRYCLINYNKQNKSGKLHGKVALSFIRSNSKTKRFACTRNSDN